MQLASYTATLPGVQGVFNRLIRWRFDGAYSHSEIAFEPAADAAAAQALHDDIVARGDLIAEGL